MYKILQLTSGIDCESFKIRDMVTDANLTNVHYTLILSTM